MNDSTAPILCMDVTTLMNWNRPVVGIVRVEQQLCRWLLEQTLPHLHFVIYQLMLRSPILIGLVNEKN